MSELAGRVAWPRVVHAPLSPRWAQVLGAAMLFLLYTRVSDLYRPAQWPVSINQLLVVIVVTLLLLRRQRLIADRGLVFMLAYGAAIALSSVGASDPVAALAALMAYLHDVVIVWVLVNVVTSSHGLRLATWTVVIAGMWVSGLALLHATTGVDFGVLATVDFGNLADKEVGYRAAGTIGNSNAFAQMLVCALPLALYRAWGERSRALRLLALGAVVLMTSVLILTYSRGGAVAFLATLAVSLTFRRFKPSYVLSVAFIAVAAVAMTPSTYWNRVTVTAMYVADGGAHVATDAASAGTVQEPVPLGPPSAEAPSIAPGLDDGPNSAPAHAGSTQDAGSLPQRLRLWRVALLMFKEHPITGVGKNNYFFHYPSYARQVDSSLVAEPKVAHSTPIQILADTGLVGLATFITLLVVVVAGARFTRRAYARGGQSDAMFLVEPIEVAIYGYLVTSLFQSDDYPRFLWLLLGLAMAAHRIHSVSSRVPTDTPGSLEVAIRKAAAIAAQPAR